MFYHFVHFKSIYKEPKAMPHLVIWEHLRNTWRIENTRLWFMFSKFLSCFQIPVVFYDSIIHMALAFLHLQYVFVKLTLVVELIIKCANFPF